MFRRMIMISLMVILVAGVILTPVLAQQTQTVDITIWNGEGRAWQYSRIKSTMSVRLYYYWFAQTEQQVLDFLAHSTFEITLDGQPVFASQDDVAAAWNPVEDFMFRDSMIKRAEWIYSLPPLALGEHTLRTVITTDVELDDGLFPLYPPAIIHNTTNIITVIDAQAISDVPPAIVPAADVAMPAPTMVPVVIPSSPQETYTEPAMGTFITESQAYWGPDESKLVNPPIVFPPGKALWVFGMDANYRFYKVILDAQYLWVRAETIGPTLDYVWDNIPLPNIVIE